MTKVNYSFEMENIGPIRSKISLTVDKKQRRRIDLAIYAKNGSGKTFLSRCFNAFNNEGAYPKNKLLNKDSNKGSFKFSYDRLLNGISEGEKTNKFEVDNLGIFNKKYDDSLIFHVFNDDYIEENFRNKNYNPSGDISGEILLGSESIELAEKKTELLKLEEGGSVENFYSKNNKDIKRQINKEVNDIINDLPSKYSIRKDIKEFSYITVENVFDCNNSSFNEDAEFNNLLLLDQKYKLLNEFDKNQDIYGEIAKLGVLDVENILFSLSKLDGLLSTKFDEKNIAKEYLEYIENNRDFIIKGLSLLNDEKCPFCSQNIKNSDEAILLISSYKSYFDEKQKKIELELSKYLSNIKNIKTTIDIKNENYAKQLQEFNKQKSFFTDYKDVNQGLLNFAGIDDLINSFILKIESKTKNISISLHILDEIQALESSLNKLNVQILSFDNMTIEFEKLKEKNKKNILQTKKDICLASLFNLKLKFKDDVKLYKKQEHKIKEIKLDIIKLQNKIPKKKAVLELLKKLMFFYFDDKYSVDISDDNIFKVKFGVDLLESPKNILSEGEKNILAFCYYLSTVYEKIDTIENLKNIVFILDDPVSSLDYEYVYKTLDIIRNMETILKEYSFENVVEIYKDDINFMILTHSIEFMSIISNNNIVNENRLFKLSENGIDNIDKHCDLLPYDEHLKIVYNVSLGNMDANYIVLNSIRHVLESIKFFIGYPEGVREFSNEQNIFTSLGVGTAMHDLSHGRGRKERPVANSCIKQGCIDVVEYIKEKYPYHLKDLISS